MKRILFPTDFSQASEKAYEVALEMASIFKAELDILHTYHVPMLQPDLPATLISELEENQRKQAHEDYKEFIHRDKGLEKFAKDKGIKLNPVIVMGLAADQIRIYAEEQDPFMTVIGKTGRGASKSVFGSISTALINKFAHPLMVVPDGLERIDLSKCIYATNFEGSDEAALRKLLSYCCEMNSSIHVVHVSEGDVDDEVMKSFADNFVEEQNEGRLNFYVIDSDEVVDSLNMYIEDNDIGLLCVLTHKRNVFQRLFHHSISKEMAYQGNCVLLVLHESAL